MKKFYRYILSALLFSVAFTACQKPEYVQPNNQADITDFYATLDGEGRDRIFESTISNDTVYVNIDYYYPINSDNEVDLTKLLLRASLPIDSRIEPSLEGFVDLTNPLKVKIIAGNGDTKEYVIVANKKGNTDLISAKLTYEDAVGVTQELDAIIIGKDVNFSIIPGTVMNNARVTYELNRHASGSIANGGSIDLASPKTFVVSSAGNAKTEFKMQAVEAKKLAKGIRPGSAKILFAKKLKGDIGIAVDNVTGGIAATSQYVVINTRNENSVVLNALTGARVGEIELGDIRGNLRNFYSTADDGGNILVNNLTPNDGNAFNIWKISNINSTPSVLISWDAAGSSYGRKISVIGDVSKNAIITAPLFGLASQNTVARWEIVNGVVKSQQPTIVTLSGFNWSWNNADVVYTNPNDVNSDYFAIGYAGNKLTKMNGATNTVSAQFDGLDANFISNAVDYIEFNNAKYVAFTHLNSFTWGSADEAFLIDADGAISGNVSTASSLVWSAPKNTYGALAAQGPANANATADIALTKSSNGYFMYMYFMFTNGYVVGVQFDCVDL